MRVEIARQPEQVEPPHRIGEKLAQRESPRLPIAQKPRPWEVRVRGRNRIRRSVRLAVAHGPPGDPSRAECAGNQERSTPAKVQCDPGHKKWRENRSHTGAGVENACSQRSLTRRKPLCRSLDGRRKIAALE